jgi:acid phosphatase type 7
MRKNFSYIILISFLFYSFLSCTEPEPIIADDPQHIFLTWTDDPTSTMVIDFHSAPEQEATPVLRYRLRGEKKWQKAEGQSFPFPYHDLNVHRIELDQLNDGSTYEFKFWGYERIYQFRTISRDFTRPLRFATGGDNLHHRPWMDSINIAVMAYDPDFIVMGGDLAYANGDPENIFKWDAWFASLKETLISPEGRVIPMLVGIGNHEVQREFKNMMSRVIKGEEDQQAKDFNITEEMRLQYAPFFYRLFAFPGQPGYSVMDFGDFLSVVILDTDHTNSIDGPQLQWLEETLSARQNTKHVIPVYHVPGYPSHRSYDGGTQVRVREHFVPLFEKYGIKVAFENHDHAYKRTHPIKAGEVVGKNEGIVYIGDGAWGQKVRPTHQDAWYLARGESYHHAIIVTLEGDHMDFKMVNKEGEVFDAYHIP